MTANYFREHMTGKQNLSRNSSLFNEIANCHQTFSEERELVKVKLEKHRQKVIRSMGKLTFDDPGFNKLLDKLNELDNEIHILESLMARFGPQSTRNERITEALNHPVFLQ